MTTPSITSNSISANVLALLKKTAEVKGKPFERVLNDYQLQLKLVAFEAQKRAWLKESENEEEEEYHQEDERLSIIR